MFNRDTLISLKFLRTFIKSFKMQGGTKQEAKFNSLVSFKLSLKNNIQMRVLKGVGKMFIFHFPNQITASHVHFGKFGMASHLTLL